LPELKIGLGLWQGIYKQVERLWLRWYDAAGDWLPTPSEQVMYERQQAKAEQQRADVAEAELANLKRLLHEKGIDLEAE
jgi:hypothetical protein